MGSVVSLNRKERRVKAALERRSPQGPAAMARLRERMQLLEAELADTRAMLLAVVRKEGRLRVEGEHLLALKEGDSVDAEPDDFGNFTLSFRGG